MWLGELSENTQHLSMSITVLEDEIVDINVTGCETTVFQNIFRRNYEFAET